MKAVQPTPKVGDIWTYDFDEAQEEVIFVNDYLVVYKILTGKNARHNERSVDAYRVWDIPSYKEKHTIRPITKTYTVTCEMGYPKQGEKYIGGEKCYGGHDIFVAQCDFSTSIVPIIKKVAEQR